MMDLESLLTQLAFDPKSPLLFNSGFFLWFFLIVMVGYTFVRPNLRMRSFYLMIVSFYFYYKSSGLLVSLLLVTCALNYLFGAWIDRTAGSKKQKTILILGITINLLLLAYFKYTNLIVGTWMGLADRPFEPFDIILPVGISFFTFQAMSYLIDIYRQRIRSLDRFVDFAFYVSFFPQLVAGPIVRAEDFIPQIARPTLVTHPMIGRGIFLIATGLIKKAIISDYISVNFVDRIFDNPQLYTGVENLMGVYGYTLQIYCDFSGYSDMAIGLALLLGFQFNINFDSPYQSASITEFWRRWHISLSSWLKDYLYISLGGNRKGRIRTYANLMITMVLGGLWHGAALQFIVWGGWHGLLLALDKLRIAIWKRIKPRRMTGFGTVGKIVGVLITFHLVCFGWIFFRADSFESAAAVIEQIATNFHAEVFPQFIDGYPYVALLIGGGYLMHLAPQRWEKALEHRIASLSIPLMALILSVIIFTVVQVRSSQIVPFIYFQF